MEVEIYASGITHCSVCAPAELTGAQVAERVEAKRPAGTTAGWRVAEAETFRTGEKNGGLVDCHNGITRHWLLVC